MKKLFLVLFLALWSLPSYASFGVQGGLNFGNTAIDPSTIPTSSMTGFIVGAHMGMEMAPNFVFEPGVQLVQRGFGLSILSASLTATINYLEVPLLFKAKFPSGTMTPFVLAGPALAMKAGSSCSATGGATCTVQDANIKSMDYGLYLGAGLSFPMQGSSVLTGSLQYYMGLANYNATADSTTTMKNNGLALVAGFDF